MVSMMRALPATSVSTSVGTTLLSPTLMAGESAWRRRLPRVVGAVAGSTGWVKRGSLSMLVASSYVADR